MMPESATGSTAIPQPVSALVVWLAMAAMLVVAASAYLSARIGIADLIANPSREAIRSWDKENVRPPLGQWLAARDRYKRALELDPANPELLETLGRLYDWRLRDQPTTSKATQAIAEQALVYFRRAVRARPASGYSWADLALTKLRLGQVDDELFRALQQAMICGPWEPAVQFIVVEVGLATWEQLPNSLQEGVRSMLERAAGRFPAQVAAIAKNHHREDVFCATVAHDKYSCEPVEGRSVGRSRRK